MWPLHAVFLFLGLGLMVRAQRQGMAG